MIKKELIKKAGFEHCKICDDWRLELFNPYGADWCLIVSERDNYGVNEVEGVEGGNLGSVETFGARLIASTFDLLLMRHNYGYIDRNEAMPYYWVGGSLQYNQEIYINKYAKISGFKFWRSSCGSVLCAACVWVGDSKFWARVSLGGCIDLYDLKI